jgi:LemA protein
MPFTNMLALTLVVLSLSGCGINNIPIYEEAVDEAWSEVLNQYQRRADLVPNLVATVKGAAAHEKEVLTGVTEARARVNSINVTSDTLHDPKTLKQFSDAQANLGSALSRLLVVAEKYPDIKANQNFLALQSQLEGTENRIAVARRDFIRAVRRYNTELNTIPGRWWRNIMYPDSVPKENFTVSKEVELNPPKVHFN